MDATGRAVRRTSRDTQRWSLERTCCSSVLIALPRADKASHTVQIESQCRGQRDVEGLLEEFVMRTALLVVAAIWAIASGQTQSPKIWDDKALADWATPIAALGVRPAHYTAADYYALPGENLKTYPVYRPDKEPPGYWEWLQKQKPQPLVDVANIRTQADWVRAGEEAFRMLDEPLFRTTDPGKISGVRDQKTWDAVWTYPDGSSQLYRWVVTPSGVQLSTGACAGCHTRIEPDGTAVKAAPRSHPPEPFQKFAGIGLAVNPVYNRYAGNPFQVQTWKRYTVPWAPDGRVERLRSAEADQSRALFAADLPETFARDHGSPFYTSKIPDLNILRYSRYIDATGTHRLRGPEDIARYSALVMGCDPMQFGEHQILSPEQRRIRVRFADEVLYAVGVYLLSLEPRRNPRSHDRALVERGREVFRRQTCVQCHAPPNYTTGKLTLAQGYAVQANHPNKADIMNVSVGTDPGLAMKTRKGTGFYKIPSLRGVWYRPLLLHDGSVASLEEMFDPARLKPDHVPGGWKGPAVTKRAISGHPFGLNINPEDKTALLAFLKSL
jgi:hypothetical protein